jgi:hypothetical protein
MRKVWERPIDLNSPPLVRVIMQIAAQETFRVAEASGEVGACRVQEELSRGERPGGDDHGSATHAPLGARSLIEVDHRTHLLLLTAPLQTQRVGSQEELEIPEASE